MSNVEKNSLEITFTRGKLVAFALRLILTAIGKAQRGRKLGVRGMDGKVFDVVFRI